MTCKPGVRVHGLKPEALFGMMVADGVHRTLGHEMVVTSSCEGVHSRGSIHYQGLAFDFRLAPFGTPGIVKEIKEQLGTDFDVVVEKTHVHVEFQPKEPL